MKTAFQVAVKNLGIAPSEFWKMVPRHFWWLVEMDRDKAPKRGLSKEDKGAILEALRGNKKGAVW